MTCSVTAVKTASMMSQAALCALLGLCLLAGLTSRAGAAAASSYVVTRTADDTAPGSLRAAIAQVAGTGGTVTFAIPSTDPGVAYGIATITLSLGPLVIPSSLNIVGPVVTGQNMPPQAVNILGPSASNVNATRVFSITGGTVTLSNLLIGNGFASPQNVNFPETGGGSGILNTANLILTNCTLNHNQALGGGPDGSGGGLANSGTASLSGCSLQGNIAGNAAGNGGGGIFNSGTISLTGCAINSNITGGNGGSPGGAGGGLLNIGSAILTNCTLGGNFTEAVAPLVGGGAVSNSGTLTLNGCFLGSNTCLTEGGGIDNVSSGTLTLNACTLSNNETQSPSNYPSGGGINNLGAAQITNCLFAGNSGLYVGGLNNGGTLTLINSTFAGNVSGGTGVFQGSGPRAGGLLSGPATLINDIFYFDVFQGSPSEIASLVGTAGPTVTYSDVQQPAGIYPGTGNINADPRFARSPGTNASYDLGDEHLLADSPAVYAGNNGPGVPPTDIVGNPRPARPSMGAYEIPPFSAQGGFTVTGTQKQNTGAQVVAKFVGGITPGPSFTATVDFGDGTGPMAGTISTDPTVSSAFQVTASHTYATFGTFTITVVISGPGGNPTATVTDTANIQYINDVTSRVTLFRGGFIYNRATQRYVQTVAIINNTGAALTGPISLVLDNLTPGATLVTATGTTQFALPAGSPYQDSTATSVAPYYSTSVVLQFTYAGSARLDYTPRVLAGPGTR